MQMAPSPPAAGRPGRCEPRVETMHEAYPDRFPLSATLAKLRRRGREEMVVPEPPTHGDEITGRGAGGHDGRDRPLAGRGRRRLGGRRRHLPAARRRLPVLPRGITNTSSSAASRSLRPACGRAPPSARRSRSQPNSSTARSPARLAHPRGAVGIRDELVDRARKLGRILGRNEQPRLAVDDHLGIPPSRDATTAVSHAIASRLTIPSGS